MSSNSGSGSGFSSQLVSETKTIANSSSTATATPVQTFDASMSRWSLSVSNADVRSAFEFVTVVGFRAPTRDEAQRVWLHLTQVQCGLHMPIASLIQDAGIQSQPVARRPATIHDAYCNRELARVFIGATEMALDDFLQKQSIINNGALAASPLIFNAALYLYRHANSYTPVATEFPHSLKEAFVTNAGNDTSALQIYNVPNLRSALAQILFVCPGCRRHCTTYALPTACQDPSNRRVQWCGAVVCNVAGPLSEAVLTAMASQQSTYQLTQGSPPRPVFLMRQRGCAEVVTQLTREMRVDASLEVWRVVMSGQLARSSLMSGVWLPSVTAWRFQAGYVPDYALEFSWPVDRAVETWQRSLARDAMSTAAAAPTQDTVHRCKLLSKRVYESKALADIEQALPRTLSNEHLEQEMRRAFPQLRLTAIGLRAMLSRLILYFQFNRTRMREADADAFGSFFLSLGVSDLASGDVPPRSLDWMPHGDRSKQQQQQCCCSGLASFLSTYSNRISLEPFAREDYMAAVAAATPFNDGDLDETASVRRQNNRRHKLTEQWQRQVASVTASQSSSNATRTRIEARTSAAASVGDDSVRARRT